MIQDIINYVSYLFNETKQQHNEVDDTILKSCLVYQNLYFKHFKTILSVNNILYIHNNEMGLIGHGNGCITRFLERTLGWIDILHSHSILHDAYGRFYDRYLLDRGHTYAISGNIKQCVYAFQTYQHLLNAIKNMLRSGEYDPSHMQITMTNTDDFITDNSPIIDKFLLKYDKLFTPE